MATTPYFVISPNTMMSIIGLIRGPDKTVPTPAEDWRKAKLDVIIPALNEEANIALCLESVRKQTFKPRYVVLVDDGSTDKTVEYARDFCEANDMEIKVIHRAAPIGKTPTLKRQSREFDSDIEFILDGDTVLDSPNYLERVAEELYKAAGIACACGCVVSMREKDVKLAHDNPVIQKFLEAHPGAHIEPKKNLFHRCLSSMTAMYRECLYMFLQRFVYRGQMTFFGSISHPVGCAVGYRRKYIKELFDKYEPILGDDLTNSEDIFIGFALANHGYRNIQLSDVLCKSRDPELTRLPHQFYMWSSSFLQSCLYFHSLTISPVRAFKRWKHKRDFERSDAGKEILNKRKIQEPYRQPFGDEYTDKYGRPIGWSIFMSLLEKIMFPFALLMMIALQMWEPLLVTIIVETCFSTMITMVVAPRGQRIRYLSKGLLMTPVRYSALLFDTVTILRFAVDVWIRRNRKWRK